MKSVEPERLNPENLELNHSETDKMEPDNLNSDLDTHLNTKSILHTDSNTLPTIPPTKPQEDWQLALSNAVTNPKQLYKRLQLDTSVVNNKYAMGVQQAADNFRVFATESFLKRVELGNWNDPLLQQILPLADENLLNPAYQIDPLAEQEANQVPGLLHKYHGRALLITNSHCAINCRFCFRKNFPYAQNHYSTNNKAAIKDYLKRHTDISEVILSGGDPLLLNDRSLTEIFDLLASLPHIKRLRIHSRIPIVLPERITTSLLSIFETSPLKIILVIHCNHSQEINKEVSEGLAKLKTVCFSLLNQSVLLKGVNNKLETLIELQHSLFEQQVQSYYLHLLDKVQGTAHFDIPRHEALALYDGLQKNLPGYMVPKLVEEVAHELSKKQVYS